MLCEQLFTGRPAWTLLSMAVGDKESRKRVQRITRTHCSFRQLFSNCSKCIVYQSGSYSRYAINIILFCFYFSHNSLPVMNLDNNSFFFFFYVANTCTISKETIRSRSNHQLSLEDFNSACWNLVDERYSKRRKLNRVIVGSSAIWALISGANEPRHVHPLNGSLQLIY